MTTEEINKRNNAAIAFMGGPMEIRQMFFPEMKEDKFHRTIGPSDMQFHSNWNWTILLWRKIRHKLSPTMIITAISCIDEAELEKLWILLSQVCMNWCKENNIKYE